MSRSNSVLVTPPAVGAWPCMTSPAASMAPSVNLVVFRIGVFLLAGSSVTRVAIGVLLDPLLLLGTLDVHVLSFVVGTTLLTAMLFGILPALFVSRANLVDFIKSGASRGVIGARSRLGSGLVIAQVALVVILLTGAGLLIRSYENVLSVKTGFSQTTISMSLQLDDRYGQPQQRSAFFQSLAARLNTMPGVRAAGAVNNLPLSKSESMTIFWADGFPNQKDQLVQ